jgi:hypothetical protein
LLERLLDMTASSEKRLARLSRYFPPARLAWLIIAVGIAVRLSAYLHNRSVWMDEAMLWLNVISRPYAGLLLPLDYDQAAPVGFLVLLKFAVETLGSSEYVLRLVPLLAGCFSLVLFYRLARQWMAPGAVPIALGLFALSDYLIFYSVETKQYAVDLFVALVLLLLASEVLSKGLTGTRAAMLGVVGALAVWLSHASVFVLAGIGSTLFVRYVLRKEWASAVQLSAAGALWAGSFLASYLLVLRFQIGNELLQSFHAERGGFLPFPPTSLGDVRWLVETTFIVFVNPIGLPKSMAGVAVVASLVGLYFMFRDNRWPLLVALSPLPFALAASALRLYPFYDRFLLFAVPAVLLLLAEGARKFVDRSFISYPAVGAVIIGLLVLHPTLTAAHRQLNPQGGRFVQDMRELVQHFGTQGQQGDTVYLGRASLPAFKYYSARYQLQPVEAIEGTYSMAYDDLARDLENLRGRSRVWVFIIRRDETATFFRYALDRLGQKVDARERRGAALYLYDFGPAHARSLATSSSSR